MTKDEIIEMAKQVDMAYVEYISEESMSKVKAFAKLVAAKEREACAKTVEKIETYEKIEKACFKFAAKTIRARGEA